MDNLIFGVWNELGIILFIITLGANLYKTYVRLNLHNSSIDADTPLLWILTIIPLVLIFIFNGITAGIVSLVVVWGLSFLMTLFLS